MKTTGSKTKVLPYGICHLPCVPLRATPNDSSEMISQLLFGETVYINGTRGKNWLHISCEWDLYEGWIDKKQIVRIDKNTFEKSNEQHSYALEVSQAVLNDNFSIHLLLGSTLSHFDGMAWKFLGEKLLYQGQVYAPNNLPFNATLFEKIAKRFLKAPYLWGGRSIFGIDCSGYTQLLFKIFGYRLPRDASQQISAGDLVDFPEEARLGDLAFFENKEKVVNHVGILLGDNKIIHASGEVRIDDFDHFGIYNGDRRSYSHKLRLIKRIIPLASDIYDSKEQV